MSLSGHAPASPASPLTSKQLEACPHCGGRNLTRRGTRKKKLEIVQLWRCASCKRTFTPGPAALHNKTYPLRMILSALTDYDLGYALEEAAGGSQEGAPHRRAIDHRVVAATSTSSTAPTAAYARPGLRRFPANQTIRSIKLYHRQVYGFAYHRPKLDLLAAARSTTNAQATARFALARRFPR